MANHAEFDVSVERLQRRAPDGVRGIASMVAEHCAQHD